MSYSKHFSEKEELYIINDVEYETLFILRDLYGSFAEAVDQLYGKTHEYITDNRGDMTQDQVLAALNLISAMECAPTWS